ncbi:hypothetical protein TNCV_4778991 [Trichonephila clavipes]|nr:hypothetical protein TNCV_4778991 [Trichonephila clavipes]
MSSRMEHLTISFFAVLEERGQMNLLEWCMRENLISSRYECPKCGKNMVMRERKGTIDGYEWRCRTKGGENPHDKLLGAVDTRGYLRAENRVWSDQEDHEERGSKDRAASTCGPHSDSFNDMSRRRRSNCSTNNFQTPCRSKS